MLERGARWGAFRLACHRYIRDGNLWDYDLVSQSKSPLFLERLKLLMQADLVLDTAHPNVERLNAIVRVSDAVPEMPIVREYFASQDPDVAEKYFGRNSIAAYKWIKRRHHQPQAGN